MTQVTRLAVAVWPCTPASRRAWCGSTGRGSARSAEAAAAAAASRRGVTGTPRRQHRRGRTALRPTHFVLTLHRYTTIACVLIVHRYTTTAAAWTVAATWRVAAVPPRRRRPGPSPRVSAVYALRASAPVHHATVRLSREGNEWPQALLSEQRAPGLPPGRAPVASPRYVGANGGPQTPQRDAGPRHRSGRAPAGGG
jgi:hypothetical protein